MAEVVNSSSTTNVAVTYPAWQWEDWRSFLQPQFRALSGIRCVGYKSCKVYLFIYNSIFFTLLSLFVDIYFVTKFRNFKVFTFRKYQYFRCAQDSPGSLFVRERHGTDETKIQLYTEKGDQLSSTDRPHTLAAAGLSAQRRSYMTKTVIPYVDAENRNAFL